METVREGQKTFASGNNRDTTEVVENQDRKTKACYSQHVAKKSRVENCIKSFVVRFSESVKGKTLWGCSSAGRAPALQAGGQEFESLHLHHGRHKPGTPHGLIAQQARARA